MSRIISIIKLFSVVVTMAIVTTLGMVGASAPAQAAPPPGAGAGFDPVRCIQGVKTEKWQFLNFSGATVTLELRLNGGVVPGVQTTFQDGETASASFVVDLADGVAYVLQSYVNGELDNELSGIVPSCTPPQGANGTLTPLQCGVTDREFDWSFSNQSTEPVRYEVSAVSGTVVISRDLAIGGTDQGVFSVVVGYPTGTAYEFTLWANGGKVTSVSGNSPDCSTPTTSPPPPTTPPPPPPADGDGDGTPDSSDACPTVTGPASNGGCPLPPPTTPPVTPPPPPAVIKVVKATVITKALPKRLVKTGKSYALYAGVYNPATVKKTVQWFTGAAKGKKIVWSRVRGATKPVFKMPKPGLLVRACVTVSKVGYATRVVCTANYRVVR